MFKRFDESPKGEQVFVLLLLCIVFLGVFCVSGCGGNSCEEPQYGFVNEEGNTIVGVSLPGCGGCLTPEKGCDSSCWPQACKFVAGNIEDDEGTSTVAACDIRYYGDGCMGCGQDEKSCYYGCINSDDIKGGFRGTSEDEEAASCVNGGCEGSENVEALIHFLEEGLGVN